MHRALFVCCDDVGLLCYGGSAAMGRASAEIRETLDSRARSGRRRIARSVRVRGRSRRLCPGIRQWRNGRRCVHARGRASIRRRRRGLRGRPRRFRQGRPSPCRPELAHVIAARRAVLAGKFRPSEQHIACDLHSLLAFYHALPRGVPGIFAHKGRKDRIPGLFDLQYKMVFLVLLLPSPRSMPAVPRYPRRRPCGRCRHRGTAR